MSYIQCVAIPEQVILTSDGRVTLYDGCIIQEDYKKIRRINNGVAIAYAGDKLLCELLLRDLTERLNNKIETANVDIVYDIIMDICLEHLDQETNYKAQLIIGGMRRSGKLGFKTLSTNNNYDTKDYLPNKGQLCFASATLNDDASNILGNKLEEMFNNRTVVNITDIYKAMNEASRYVATIDNSVNDKIYREIIKI